MGAKHAATAAASTPSTVAGLHVGAFVFSISLAVTPSQKSGRRHIRVAMRYSAQSERRIHLLARSIAQDATSFGATF